ncbi:hypothetical protein BJ322DRAFT_1007764 [Thelephora terrestris]|uniref:Uncharacterized protein n=1 Tax=Thelephora terrestris TaxID=56493 RepID=A0A9P6HEE1_9AGAM|nr:hypothetical protein BJ322DRAFT_1007764 [Thelephora terrestris]
MICTPQTTFKLSNRIGLLTIEVGSTFLKSDSGATNRFLLTGSGDQTPDNGDIKIEYHPHSGKGTHILSSDEYRESFRDHSEPTPPDDDRPWLPFSSQEDFEFTEFVHDAALNQKQINRLIKLIRTCQKEPNKFTFRNFKDMRASLDNASKLLTPFKRHEVTCDFEGDGLTYETQCRPLWDWILDHLVDPDLVRQFEWDARKVFRYNKEKDTYVQLYTEPWTGKRFWDVQSNLPADAKMLCLELYADKTKLSLFGTQKGYPVMARILNLPVGIRNGDGFGGARVVGWLPVVEDDAKNKGRPGWVDFKRVVWHASFYKLLESISEISEIGHWVRCGDGVERHVFPLILILSADYEEQSVMALIRGVGSLYPCPRCLVADVDLDSFPNRSRARTAQQTKATIEEAREQDLVGESEEILKNCGLRDIDNIFWKIKNSDPHDTLSFDRLHTFPGGLFRHHLWVHAKTHAQELGRAACTTIDDMANTMPRWRDFNHFSAYLSVDFTDGSKWEDMSKICVPVMRSTLGEDASGRRLLSCIRAYVELDVLSSLNLHTDTTIKYGRKMEEKFFKLAHAYNKGGWKFPKMHLTTHLFDDIESKGATRNYTSKTFKKLHGPLGETYERRTNFKDIANQVSNYYTTCRHNIDRLDAFHEKARRDAADAVDPTTTSRDQISCVGESYQISSGTNHSTALGSKLETKTIDAFLESETKKDDLAFNALRSRITQVIRALSGQSDLITEYMFVKVGYESIVNWEIKTDYLRCNPKFHGKSRYDFVIVDLPRGRVFAQLACIFVCRVGRHDYRLALIQALDKSTRQNAKAVDKELSILRWHIRARSRCEVIPLDSIVRGAVLLEDIKNRGDYFVIDTLDGDMFLRLKQKF